MRKIITLLIGILYLTTNLFSQNLDYDNNSRWFWGLNAGGTWHTSDVQIKSGFGLGLTVGRSFNYDYGKNVSFDIRGRALYGEWKGQDRKRSNYFMEDDVLSSGDINYKDSLGYAFRNFNTDVGRLSIELVMHLNSVKERTGIDPYIFAGIGYSWYRANGNYLKTNDNNSDDIEMYDYASWDEKLTNKEYIALKDNSDETILNGSSKSKKNVSLLPSVGFGIGYQVAPRFSVGFEHKTTFTRADDFDGLVNQNSIIKNDLYHYSSIYLRFYVKPGKKHRTNPTAPTHTNNQVINRNDDMQPPRVNFTSPFKPGTTTNVSTYGVRGDITNVYDAQDVTFSHNGRESSNFKFNPSTRAFEAQVTLNEGENTFEVTGRNVYGTDRQSTTVIYKKPDPVPPIVTFQNPSSTPVTVTTNTFTLEATVLNVDQKNQIKIGLNGHDQADFSFNSTSKKTRATVTLKQGVNVVQITGVNEVGTDSKNTVLIYNPNYIAPNSSRQAPVVYFTNPSSSPYTSYATTMILDAKVLHVMNKQNVVFKQNGQINNNFNYNASNNDFRASVNLNSGQNVFEIIGTNPDGSAQATALIIYERAAYNPPVVTITNPNQNPYTASNESLNFTATVFNVTSKNQVEVKINGQPTTNFTFSNAIVQANIRLANGSTNIEVRGTNQDGTDQKNTTVIYRKATVQNPQPPIVTITSPSQNPFTATQENLNFTAIVKNVTSKNQVEVKINGQKTTNFTFNNTVVQASMTLPSGTTTIEVKGTNQDGVDQKQTVVSFRKAVTQAPVLPVVEFTNPSTGTESTTNPTYFVRGNVRYVSDESGVEVIVNGVKITRVDFNPATAALQFSAALKEGQNAISVTGTNTAGTTSKSTTILYIKEQKPEIVFTNPARCPASFNVGNAKIEGTISNVNSAKEVTFKIDGKVVYNTQTEIKDGKLKFAIPITVSIAKETITVSVEAKNSGGSDLKTCVIRPIRPTVKPSKTAPPTIVKPTTPVKPGKQKENIEKPATRQPTIPVPGRTPTVDPNAGGTREEPSRNGTTTPLP